MAFGCVPLTLKGAWGLRLEAEEFAYGSYVGVVEDCKLVEVAFAFFALLGEDVAVVGVFSFDFTRTGKGEPFFGTGVSFNLGHCCFL